MELMNMCAKYAVKYHKGSDTRRIFEPWEVQKIDELIKKHEGKIKVFANPLLPVPPNTQLKGTLP
jgi:hypothetical protein